MHPNLLGIPEELTFTIGEVATSALSIELETETLYERMMLQEEAKKKESQKLKSIDGRLYYKGKLGFSHIMSDIVDVEVIENNGKPRVVVVRFADGTLEKAVLSEEDTFSLEQGISICLTKKLLSDRTSDGSSVYNKIIKRAMKIYEQNTKREEEIKEIEEAYKKKREKIAKKKAAKKAKRENAAREREIQIQTEAYLRAMREYNTPSK